MSNATEYDFSSVGDSLATVKEAIRYDDLYGPVNYNPKTPLEFSQGTAGLFIMNTGISSSIRDNLKNLLLTNWGERVGQYQFGANLKPLTGELGTPAFDSEAMIRIRTAVKKYMPYVALAKFSTEILHEEATPGLGAVKIKLTYSVPGAGIASDGIGITLLASG
jgi:phage baseplate assembly protein W